jgi:hypothetical protein
MTTRENPQTDRSHEDVALVTVGGRASIPFATNPDAILSDEKHRRFERQRPRRLTRCCLALKHRPTGICGKGSYGYKRTTGGHGGLPLRRVLRVDGSKTCGGGPKQWRIRDSHLRVRRVRPYANLQRSRGKQLKGRVLRFSRTLFLLHAHRL